MDRTIPSARRHLPEACARDDARARYASPQEVLHDDRLSLEQKRNVLSRWALDIYAGERALSNGNLFSARSPATAASMRAVERAAAA